MVQIVTNKFAQKKTTSFWTKLPKPFFVLAPMANVTDFAFRSMIAKYGKPDVMWSEFVSADGLNSHGKTRLLQDLKFSDKERPIVAQLFTGHPDAMRNAAHLCAELGFDGIDINMGCPDRSVEKQGGGATHIKEPKMALEVLEAAREGWREVQRLKVKSQKFNSKVESVVQVPVSIKTRLGYNKIDFNWLRLLLEQKLPALTIHLRTRKEMSDAPAHWELMPEIIQLRDEVQADMPVNERTLIIGNGDVKTIVEAALKCKKYGCDGVMIGRGIFGMPWLFEYKDIIRNNPMTIVLNNKSETTLKSKIQKDKTPKERLKIMLEHAQLFEKSFDGKNADKHNSMGKSDKNGKKRLKNFAVMKKHFKAYVSGWDGARELRVKLMEVQDLRGVKMVVDEYLKR